jgi:AraC-like DNA-binding protein
MQSLNNVEAVAREEQPIMALPTVGLPRWRSTRALPSLSCDLDGVSVHPPQGTVAADAGGIQVPFDPDAVGRHAAALLGVARAEGSPVIERLLRPGRRFAADDASRRVLAEFPLFLRAPGAPDPDAPAAHSGHADDIVQRAIARLLLVLEGEDVARLERRDPSITVDRACGFMDANIARPLSLPEVARAASTSVRTLQYAFLARFGMSPMRWLREQRLRRLHAALQGAAEDQGVAELAGSLGFTHLGRLGQLFEPRFGLLPSRLLRRRRGG